MLLRKECVIFSSNFLKRFYFNKKMASIEKDPENLTVKMKVIQLPKYCRNFIKIF